MKFTVTLAILIGCASYCVAQKPALDTSVFGKWPTVGQAKISNDGKYALYCINEVSHQVIKKQTLVVQATQGNWKLEVPKEIFDAVFTPDNKHVVFYPREDSLGIIQTGSNNIQYLANIRSSRLEGNHLVYQLNTPPYEVRYWNLETDKNKTFQNITQYALKENVLLLQSEKELQWYDINKDQTTSIWEGNNAVNFTFDKDLRQLAFIANNAVWYYKTGNKNAIQIADSTKADSGLFISSIREFSNDGKLLFFKLKEKPKPQPVVDPEAVKVDIWSYTDTRLKSQQLLDKPEPAEYVLAINPEDKRILRVEQHMDNMLAHSDETALICHSLGDGDMIERHWNPACKKEFYLLDFKTGNRKKLDFEWPILSPGGKFLIYYLPEQKNYFSYEISTGKQYNITKGINTKWTQYQNDYVDSASAVNTMLSYWLPDDEAVVLHDQHEFWQVNLKGEKAPLNLTNGFGKKNNIAFFMANLEHGKTIKHGDELILTAFNHNTKENGFYKIKVGQKTDPTQLTMGNYLYNAPEEYISNNGEPVRKATDANAYLVYRMRADTSPNYFYTTDFKNYSPISNTYPEQQYNWLQTDLINWLMPDGRTSQGVLYKPENFDPKKKYPLLIFVYEKMSNNLHVYNSPEASSGPINIPWFVSNGYLVFTPDIHYTVGEPGESARKAIVSAAEFLSKQPFVDPAKLGLQGHSFGGYETNFVVTQTKLFAAACSASGITDMISGSGSIGGDGASLQGVYEIGQPRLACTLWDKPEVYIKNSPIFFADKITTPLLMMHTKDDTIVPFAQGIELFTGMRRLQKRAWMLVYSNESHCVVNPDASMDYTVRMSQFFDHYLKGTPAPIWMTEGVPAAKKGIENGLRLDLSRKMP